MDEVGFRSGDDNAIFKTILFDSGKEFTTHSNSSTSPSPEMHMLSMNGSYILSDKSLIKQRNHLFLLSEQFEVRDHHMISI